MKDRALTLAPSEAEAIERAKQGDAEAFALLYGLHKRRVYSLCLCMTGNSAKAEDLTQEAFLQLFRKIGTFRGESAFSTWLHRMAVNVVLMQLRKKSLPVVPLEETLESEEETPKKELVAAGIPTDFCIARCGRIRTQRDCCHGGMLYRQQQISATQSAHEAARVAQDEPSRKGRDETLGRDEV